jgi:hypothetical protein
MSKKYSMFTNGTVVVNEENGDVRRASQAEVNEHLASQLPGTYHGESLQAVAFNKEDGHVYGRYATRKVRKEIFANQTPNQSEPVDGPQKVKDTKVPSDPKKGKPETAKITKERPDVGKPAEVRTKEYQRGKGAEDLHSEVVPRSGKDGGLKGGKVAPTAEEKADKATSGNPDTYVQDLGDCKKPTPAGNEMNHAASTAGSEIKWENDSIIYQNLNLSKQAKDDKKDNLPPWLQKDDDKKDDDEKDDDGEKKDEECDDKEKDCKDETEATKKSSEEFSQIKTALQEKEAEVTKIQTKIARIEKAARYALALLQLNPEKYSNSDKFVETINQTAERMDEHAIQIAIDELGDIYAEREKNKQTMQSTAAPVEALWGQEDQGGLATAIMIPQEDRFNKSASGEGDLKTMIMNNMKLGRDLKEWEDYVPSEPKMGMK